MSILMDALKQQQPISAAVVTSSLWRNVALVLGFILALLLGAAAAYFFLPTLHSTAPSVVVDTVKPSSLTKAEPEQILAALNMAEITTNENSKPEPSAEIKSSAKTERFTTPPPIVTVIANTQQDIIAVTPKTSDTAEVAEVEISDALRDKFSMALQATEHSNSKPARRTNEAPAADISELAVDIRQSIPSLSFEAHVYATASRQRWVKVNGKTLQENQWVTADIKIKEITPQYVLLEYGSTLFSMAALSNWTSR